MKCDRCKKDFNYFSSELVLGIFYIRGFNDVRYKIKRLVCNECCKIYAKLEQQ